MVDPGIEFESQFANVARSSVHCLDRYRNRRTIGNRVYSVRCVQPVQGSRGNHECNSLRNVESGKWIERYVDAIEISEKIESAWNEAQGWNSDQLHVGEHVASRYDDGLQHESKIRSNEILIRALESFVGSLQFYVKTKESQ